MINSTQGLESDKISMFLVMFDSKKHRELFPSDDGNLAVKELAWTALRYFLPELPSRWEMRAG